MAIKSSEATCSPDKQCGGICLDNKAGTERRRTDGADERDSAGAG